MNREKVGQSEVAVDRRATGFRAQVISLKDLCLDDLHRKILIKVMDNNVHSSWGASVIIGQFTTTVYDVLHDINKRMKFVTCDPLLFSRCINVSMDVYVYSISIGRSR
jgi:hypothetical protein